VPSEREKAADIIFKTWADVISMADDETLAGLIGVCADIAESEKPFMTIRVETSRIAATEEEAAMP
jgi:hypothetical protein